MKQRRDILMTCHVESQSAVVKVGRIVKSVGVIASSHANCEAEMRLIVHRCWRPAVRRTVASGHQLPNELQGQAPASAWIVVVVDALLVMCDSRSRRLMRLLQLLLRYDDHSTRQHGISCIFHSLRNLATNHHFHRSVNDVTLKS